MMCLFLATAFSLSTGVAHADTTRLFTPPPISRTISQSRAHGNAHVAPNARTFANTRAAATPRISAVDKLQHFAMSFAVESFAYAAARSAGVDRGASLTIAAATTAAAGIGKELFDARHDRPFSGYDLAADALGGAAAYTLLRQVH
jgi:hypothetical protein